MRMDPAVAAIRRAVRAELDDLEPGDVVVAAVSGGADSMALAAALAAEAPKLTIRAGALTVDHGLQQGSRERAEQVVAHCAALGLEPVAVVGVTVDRDQPGGPEGIAREMRYAALSKQAAELGATAVLLGHTLDDQAETVLLRLARGSGARSLAAMPRRRDIYRRPLLGIRRETTVAACAAWGIEAWQDPHNVDHAFTRVRVRERAMPTLVEALGPGVPEALARSADLLRDDADALDQWAESVPRDLPLDALAELPVAVRTRFLRRLAIEAGVAAGALSADHVHEIDRLVTEWRGQGGVHLPGGLVATRSCDRLSFR
jgi:tRNA(Ile)-lysidine synthase